MSIDMLLGCPLPSVGFGGSAGVAPAFAFAFSPSISA